MDDYQKRYIAHQERKRDVLIEIMQERHSNRRFSDADVTDKAHSLIDAVDLCPSSCDRKGVSLKLVTDRDEKALLSGLLVGGTGWIHRAPALFLLFADPIAYKAGDEIDYMPYLDAGVVVQQLYLTATSLGLHCAFVNPNIREVNKPHFAQVFGDKIFCGAFAFGYPHHSSVKNQLGMTEEETNLR